MFVYKPIKEQLIEEKRKNADLQDRLDKTVADLDYVAMMTDVDLEPEREGLVDEE